MCQAPLWYWLLALLFRAPGGLARLKRLMARGQPLRQAGLRAKAKGKFKAKTEGLAWAIRTIRIPSPRIYSISNFKRNGPTRSGYRICRTSYAGGLAVSRSRVGMAFAECGGNVGLQLRDPRRSHTRHPNLHRSILQLRAATFINRLPVAMAIRETVL